MSEGMTPERRAEIEYMTTPPTDPEELAVSSVYAIRELFTEIDRLTEQWQELLDAHRAVLEEECSESDDRVHCTCVPFLRQEIDRLNKVVDQAIEVADIPTLFYERPNLFDGIGPDLAAELQRRGK